MSRPALAPGLVVAGALAAAASAVAALPALRTMSISPLIAAIAMGIAIANLWPRPLPLAWLPGLTFAARRVLRLGIVLYGLRISVQAIAAVGLPGVAMILLVVVSTLLAGAWLGRRLLGLDRDTALVTAAGSAVCGAAAVLAMEATLNTAPPTRPRWRSPPWWCSAPRRCS